MQFIVLIVIVLCAQILSAQDDVLVLTVTSRNETNVIEWRNSVNPPYGSTRVVGRTDGFPVDADDIADAFVAEAGPESARFAHAYKAKFGSVPSRYAANAYEAVAIVAEAIRTAREQGASAPGGARLREAMLARRVFASVYGGRVALRDDGTLERPLALFTVERGKLAFVRSVAAGERS